MDTGKQRKTTFNGVFTSSFVIGVVGTEVTKELKG